MRTGRAGHGLEGRGGLWGMERGCSPAQRAEAPLQGTGLRRTSTTCMVNSDSEMESNLVSGTASKLSRQQVSHCTLKNEAQTPPLGLDQEGMRSADRFLGSGGSTGGSQCELQLGPRLAAAGLCVFYQELLSRAQQSRLHSIFGNTT